MSKMLIRLKSDQIAARKAKNTAEVVFLSTLISEASAYATSGKERRDVTDDDTTRAILKMEKSLNEIKSLTKDDGAIVIIDSELAILGRYKPVQMTEDQLRAVIASIRAIDTDANKGSIMKALKSLGTPYDGRLAASLVDQALTA